MDAMPSVPSMGLNITGNECELPLDNKYWIYATVVDGATVMPREGFLEIVTGIWLQNESFDIYELQLLGLDKKDSCSYTNSGTATRSDTELQELLHTKGLPFPNGIVGQRIKILSNLEMQKEQAQADILQQLSSSGEELNIDG